MVHHEPKEPFAIEIGWCHRELLHRRVVPERLTHAFTALGAGVLGQEIYDAQVNHLAFVLEAVLADEDL